MPVCLRAASAASTCLGQAPRFVLHRAAPVEGELDHLVRAERKLDEIVVEQADRAVGLDAVGLPGRSAGAQAVDETPAKPDAAGRRP